MLSYREQAIYRYHNQHVKDMITCDQGDYYLMSSYKNESLVAEYAGEIYRHLRNTEGLDFIPREY
jgi:hypothetical protein